MNILFLADNFPPERNAMAARVYERACYWVRWGHQVTVITCEPNFPEGKVFGGYTNKWHLVEEMSGIRVVRVKTYIAPNAGKYRRIVDALSYMVAAFAAGLFERRPDLIVATSPQFFGALGGCVLAAVRRVPFVLELSDLWPDSVVAVGAMKRSFALHSLEKMELWMYRRAVRVVALTKAFRANLVRRGIDAGKVGVVINGVELSRYAPREKDRQLARRWGLEEQHFVVGYIGTHGMAHALDNVLDAAALDGDPDIRFLFVGGGAEQERLVAKAQRMGLRNVVFVPAQPKETMPSYWSLCDVALVHLKDTPLFGTVIPSKIFEAMGMGLPILLAAPKGEASEILEESGAGLWVAPERPQELLEAARFLKSDHQLTHRLAGRSREAAHRYTRERQAREMLAILSEAIGATMERKAASAAAR
jgi:glycosyltransferase involved in cell wall biosynthesis